MLLLPRTRQRRQPADCESAAGKTANTAVGSEKQRVQIDPREIVLPRVTTAADASNKDTEMAARPQTKVQPARNSDAGRQKPKRPDNTRETIESIVVAFVLAFLFRTFEAEAFVIPTGSMAPTLYGQQRDVYCEKCGTRFAVGVSSVPSHDAEVRDDNARGGGPFLVHGYRSQFAVCPNANCRFPNDVLTHEMFAGDRILVNKFPYEFGEPQRWDVVVFKFPEQAKTNYIKRLIGLPGERLIIENGDIKVCPIADGPEGVFRIARKPPEKQRTLQLLVHDNDRPARELLAAGWPESWDNEDGTAWTADAKARTFQIDPDVNDPEARHWLRYAHYVPTGAEWTEALSGGSVAGRAKPQWIKDFYAYNGRIAVFEAAAKVSREELPDPAPDSGEQWVGDLTLNCTVEVLAADGELRLELVEGWRRYQCQIDLKTGRGKFAYLHEQDRLLEDAEPAAAGDPFETGMNRVGRHDVSFCNVDDRLCLWVNDRLVKSLDFDKGSKFEPQYPPVDPTERDKTPARIGARGAAVRVSHLHLERDIFYRNESALGHFDESNPYVLNDYDDDQKDEFMMLGDNSPRSNDSRLWQSTSVVPRRLLIGKAFYVYWPHAVPFLNGGRGFALDKYEEPPPRGEGEPFPPVPKFSVPFYPQVGRMHRIR
jgi:signal peptidase I